MSLSFLLAQATVLLGLAWSVHVLIRRAHPRARLLLWRSVLVIIALLPLASVLPLPRMSVEIPTEATTLFPTVPVPSPPAFASSVPPATAEAKAARAATPLSAPFTSISAPTPSPALSTTPSFTLSWPRVFALLWVVGFAWEVVRLGRLRFHLRSIVHRATAAPESARMRGVALQASLGLKRPISFLVSDAIDSPCLCGVISPAILLPPALVADEIPPAELDALLSHELAHQRRHDLAWCLAWRVARAMLWFHPLVWLIPDAHMLACEEEADRLAASRVSAGDAYPQLLARLALRLLPPATTHRGLALHAASHLARRLAQLARESRAGWSTRHTLAGLAGVAALATLSASWQLTHATDAQIPTAASVPTAMTTISVRDPDGRPVAGAVITPREIRYDNRLGLLSGADWRNAVLGSPGSLHTDAEGRAQLPYPLHIGFEQKFRTSEVVFSVEHPNFGSIDSIARSVDQPAGPIWLEPGLPLRIRPYAGSSRTSVTEIEPLLVGNNRVLPRERWKPEDDGSFSWWSISSGKYFLLVAGRLPSGEIGYSEPFAFFGAQREKHDYPLELKPGIRVEGRLDERVPRPVKNGWVQLAVHSREADTADSSRSSRTHRAVDHPAFWHSHRPIAADGTFVFESVPTGELRLIAYGEGFMSSDASSEAADIRDRPLITRGTAQSFPPVSPLTAVVLAAEPAAALRVIVTANGSPVVGAEISVSPRMAAAGGGIFGRTRASSEMPFLRLPAARELAYRAVTDRAGVAVLPNIPAFTEAVAIRHERFEAPERRIGVGVTGIRRSREVAIRLTAGETTQANVAVYPR